jgi:hypothetical protein
MSHSDSAKQSFACRKSRRTFLIEAARLAGVAVLPRKMLAESPLTEWRDSGTDPGAVLRVDASRDHMVNSFGPDQSLGMEIAFRLRILDSETLPVSSDRIINFGSILVIDKGR